MSRKYKFIPSKPGASSGRMDWVDEKHESKESPAKEKKEHMAKKMSPVGSQYIQNIGKHEYHRHEPIDSDDKKIWRKSTGGAWKTTAQLRKLRRKN